MSPSLYNSKSICWKHWVSFLQSKSKLSWKPCHNTSFLLFLIIAIFFVPVASDFFATRWQMSPFCTSCKKSTTFTLGHWERAHENNHNTGIFDKIFKSRVWFFRVGRVMYTHTNENLKFEVKTYNTVMRTLILYICRSPEHHCCLYSFVDGYSAPIISPHHTNKADTVHTEQYEHMIAFSPSHLIVHW